MTHLTKRQLKAQKTKKNLLETGLQLFRKKGFDNVKVDDIVKKCNLSKGAFYVHFDSKYDLFNERFKEIDKFYIDFKKKIPAEMTATEKILMFHEGQMIFLRDELGKDLVRNVYMNAMSLTIRKNHFLTDPERNLYKVIKSFVEEGIQNKEFKENISIEETLRFINRCMRGTIYDWIILGDDFNITEEMNKFTSIFLKGLRQ